MALANRLGVAGLIVAVLSIAAFGLWPEKKGVEQVYLALAFVLLAAIWGWMEFGNSQIGRTLVAFLCAGSFFGVIWYFRPSPTVTVKPTVKLFAQITSDVVPSEVPTEGTVYVMYVKAIPAENGGGWP
jgi:hypothetical protein